MHTWLIKYATKTMRRQAVVVGAGTMGAGIALLAAAHGLEVCLVARSRESLERGRGRMGAALAFLAGEGYLPAGEAERALARLRTETDLAAALPGADLILEAVTESADVKRAVYVAIGAHAQQDEMEARPASVVEAQVLSHDVFILLGSPVQVGPLGLHAMNVARRNRHTRDEFTVGHAVVTRRMVRPDSTLVAPEEMHSPPIYLVSVLRGGQ